MVVSLCYPVLRHVLRLAVPSCRSRDFKELEIVVLQHELGILRRQAPRPTMTTVDRLFLAARAGSCRVYAGDRPHHAEHVAPVTSVLGRQAVDIVTASRPATDSPRGSGAGVASRERKPAVGISTHRWGAQRVGRHGLGDVGADMASGRWPRAGRHSPRLDLARIHPIASAKRAS